MDLMINRTNHICRPMAVSALSLSLWWVSACAGPNSPLGTPVTPTFLATRVPALLLGDSIQDVLRKTDWLVKVPPQNFLSKWPFEQRLPFLSVGSFSVWTDDGPGPYRSPRYFVAVFAEDGRLVDWLLIANTRVKPLVNGQYARRLAGLRKGMSVEEMRHRLGTVQPDYVRGSDGQWQVHFYYSGFAGLQFRIEADAATGIIESVVDETI